MNAGTRPSLPISALLSQVLVAFTIELDNEFAVRMGNAGYRVAGVSWIAWLGLMRFIGKGISVRELGTRSLAPDGSGKFALGCLERWHFIYLDAATGDDHSIREGRDDRRDGFGSGRGIRKGWIVRLTEKGQRASEIWPPLFGEIEKRWDQRFGATQFRNLRRRLQEIVRQIDLDLPQALPPEWPEQHEYSARSADQEQTPADLPFLTLLSQVLLAFAIEFNRESKAPIGMCANVLRVLGQGPVRLGDLPRLTGVSPERADIGWWIKPYVSVVPDPTAKRRKIASLTPRGKQAEQTYHRLSAEIEKRWYSRFGATAIQELRESLLQLFERRGTGPSPLAQCMIPPEGVARAGTNIPALGRRKVAPAAQQRVRDMVAQTAMFVTDPAGTLPHYPLWDMNRGFGP